MGGGGRGGCSPPAQPKIRPFLPSRLNKWRRARVSGGVLGGWCGRICRWGANFCNTSFDVFVHVCVHVDSRAKAPHGPLGVIQPASSIFPLHPLTKYPGLSHWLPVGSAMLCHRLEVPREGASSDTSDDIARLKQRRRDERTRLLSSFPWVDVSQVFLCQENVRNLKNVGSFCQKWRPFFL